MGKPSASTDSTVEEKKEDVLVEHADKAAETALKEAEKSDLADTDTAPPHNTITDNFRSQVDQPNLYPEKTAEKIGRLKGEEVVERHLQNHAGDPAWDSDVKHHPGETEKSEAKAAKEQNDK